jgi:hypothetical protein
VAEITHTHTHTHTRGVRLCEYTPQQAFREDEHRLRGMLGPLRPARSGDRHRRAVDSRAVLTPAPARASWRTPRPMPPRRRIDAARAAVSPHSVGSAAAFARALAHCSSSAVGGPCTARSHGNRRPRGLWALRSIAILHHIQRTRGDRDILPFRPARDFSRIIRRTSTCHSNPSVRIARPSSRLRFFALVLMALGKRRLGRVAQPASGRTASPSRPSDCARFAASKPFCTVRNIAHSSHTIAARAGPSAVSPPRHSR